MCAVCDESLCHVYQRPLKVSHIFLPLSFTSLSQGSGQTSLHTDIILYSYSACFDAAFGAQDVLLKNVLATPRNFCISILLIILPTCGYRPLKENRVLTFLTCQQNKQQCYLLFQHLKVVLTLLKGYRMREKPEKLYFSIHSVFLRSQHTLSFRIHFNTSTLLWFQSKKGASEWSSCTRFISLHMLLPSITRRVQKTPFLSKLCKQRAAFTLGTVFKYDVFITSMSCLTFPK